MNLPPEHPGGGPGAATPGPYHWRLVDPGSRTAAFLRRAGLHPTQIAPATGGAVWVTLPEAEDTAAHLGIEVDLPEPLPAPSRIEARRYARKLAKIGAHVIRLHPGTKVPVEAAWQKSAPMTVAEITDWLASGGNIGVVLARSGDNGWIVFDAENAPATAFATAAGMVPTAVTANAQDQFTGKFGGSHVWSPIPVGVDITGLRSRLGVSIGDGGKADILLGDHFAVAPGSRLDCAPGVRYEFSGDGPAFRPEVWGAVDLSWLWDASAPLPAGFASVPGAVAVHGILRPAPRPKRAPNADSDDLTQQVDAVDVETWLDGHPDIELVGLDGSCGCPVFHYRLASTLRSGIWHVGCEYGYGVHFFSGTLIAAYGGKEHDSPLNFAAWLHGVSASDAARRVGIRLGRSPLSGWSAEALKELAAAESFATTAAEPVLTVLAGGGVAPAEPSAPTRLSAVPPIGSVSGGGGPVYVHGAAAPQSPELEQDPDPATGTGTAAAEPSPATGDTDDLTGVASGDEAGHLTAAKARADALMARADDPELLDNIFCTDLLREIRRRAKSAQVSPMVSLSANLNAILGVVPPRVTLPKLVGKRRSPLNLITAAVDESGGGKGGLTTADIDPVSARTCPTLPDVIGGVVHVPSPITVGSGEAIAGAFSSVEKDKESGVSVSVNHTDSVWFAWEEITKVLAVRDRKGSTIEAELCLLYSGERLGSATKTNALWTDAMSYRGLVSIAAQLATAGGLFVNEFVGLLQRTWFVSAAFRMNEEDASPEKLAAGRRSEDGLWFAEPEGDDELIQVVLPEWPAGGVIPVAADVAAEIEAARAAHGLGDKKHPWDRHELQTRLRLATGGAILHGTCAVTMFWWVWAGFLMEHSRFVRAAAHALSGVMEAKTSAAAGVSDAIRADVRDKTRWDNAVVATARWAENQGRFTLRDVRKSSKGSLRETHAPEILAVLVDAGVLSTETVAGIQGDVIFYRHTGRTFLR
jgi:hypothetical protein